MTTKTYPNASMAPDGSSYVTLTDGAGNLVTAGGSSGITIGSTAITGGATTQVLFNLAGVVSSDAGLTYSGGGSTATLSIGNKIQFTGTNPGAIKSVSFGSLQFWASSTSFLNYDGSGGVFLSATSTNGVAFWTDTSGSAFTGRMGFGGSTSAFPALARSGTTLQVKLADGSADAPISASGITNSTTRNDTGYDYLTPTKIGRAHV